MDDVNESGGHGGEGRGGGRRRGARTQTERTKLPATVIEVEQRAERTRIVDLGFAD